MRTGRTRAVVRVTVASAGLLVATVLPVTPVSAATVLHFYSKTTKIKFIGPDGKAVKPEQVGPGSAFISFAVDYKGNHKKHDTKYSASDHSKCTILTENTAVCDIQVAIGGSMLIADGAVLDDSGTQTVKITGGTGKYAKAKGTMKSVQIGDTDNSDITINLK